MSLITLRNLNIKSALIGELTRRRNVFTMSACNLRAFSCSAIDLACRLLDPDYSVGIFLAALLSIAGGTYGNLMRRTPPLKFNLRSAYLPSGIRSRGFQKSF